MLRVRFFPLALVLSFACVIGCSAGSDSVPTPGKPFRGDTVHHTLAIAPSASTVSVGTQVIFTLTSSPGLPKPYTISWQIDNAQPTVRTNVDTLSSLFAGVGAHTISAVYSDSTGVKRDSAKTTITVSDTTTVITSGLGGFKVVIGTDTLDRSQFQKSCTAMANWLPNTPGSYQLSIMLDFSKTSLNDPGEKSIGLYGIVTAPVAATYPIAASNSTGQFYGIYDSGSNFEYWSVAGGTLTITKFDTINDLISGTFRMPASMTRPSKDPNNTQTIAGSFSDVGITLQMFNQGSFDAKINDSSFHSAGSVIEAALLPATGMLTISARDVPGPNVRIPLIKINTPQLGTFPFGDGTTPGTAFCSYYSGNIFASTQGHTNCGSLTITAFDAVNRRLSGTFTATTFPDHGPSVQLTNGVLDNVIWVQE